MRLAAPSALLVLAAVLLLGCGSSGESTTSSSSPGAGASTREVRAAWERTPACRRPQGASRWGCSVGSYRCQGVVTDRGWSISCAKPGLSLSFTVKPG